MKMTLEINMTNGQDIVDAMNALKALADRNAVLIEEAEYHEESENMKSLESPSLDEVDVKVEIEDTQVNEELKSELESYKKIVDELKKEKASLINEKELLNDKIASLEIELESTPSEPSLDDLLDGMEIEVNNGVESSNTIKELEEKIAKLEKDVTFHEGRSNKNFEEVKRLRALVDSISSEKRGLEKKVASLENELELSKNAENSNMDIESINKIKEENQLLLEKVNSFERTKERLNKEIEFQKNRSKTNWEDLKTLKHDFEVLEKEKEDLSKKIEELTVNSDNVISKEDVVKLKTELIQVKSEYESTISELRLSNDKLQNELNLCNSKFNETDAQELDYLKKIKQAICANERGAAFWNGVESTITNL